MSLSRPITLGSLTDPTTPTEWPDGYWHIPPINHIDRPRYRSWLATTTFFPSSNPRVWEAITANWLSFLSAIGLSPSAIPSPNREIVRWSSDPESATNQAERFNNDRRARQSILQAVWKLFDQLEALTERWPPQARFLLNESTDEAHTSPFRTSAARPDSPERRRYNAIWIALICFIIYFYLRQRHLSKGLCDNILDSTSCKPRSGMAVP